MWMKDYGNQNWISLVTVMQLFVSCLHQKVKNFLGSKCSNTHSKAFPTGKWYIENSLTTLGGQKDPVSDYNSQLWNTGLESDKEIARKQKRKLEYYSNIYVVSDSKHPENEGKVFLV